MQLVKKKLKQLLILIIMTFSFIGCGQKQLEITRIEASCKTPDVECDFKGDNIDNIIEKMVKCIIDLKRANEKCK